MREQEFQGYREFVTNANTSGEYPVYVGCNGFVVINTGADVVTVNNVRLLPAVAPGLSGQSYGLAGNAGEAYDKPTFKVVFDGATTPQLVTIVQKVYSAKSYNR